MLFVCLCRVLCVLCCLQLMATSFLTGALLTPCLLQALPLFLDRLANPVTAILLSVTAVLFFGEIIPQSVCTR